MKRKKLLIIGILFVILVLGIGYAFLNTTLSMNGTDELTKLRKSYDFLFYLLLIC